MQRNDTSPRRHHSAATPRRAHWLARSRWALTGCIIAAAIPASGFDFPPTVDDAIVLNPSVHLDAPRVLRRRRVRRPEFDSASARPQRLSDLVELPVTRSTPLDPIEVWAAPEPETVVEPLFKPKRISRSIAHDIEPTWSPPSLPELSPPMELNELEPSIAPEVAPGPTEIAINDPPPRRTDVASPQALAAASRLRTMARQSMRDGKQLFDRGAVYSAHQAVISSLRQLVQASDLSAGGNRCTAALTAAMRATEEAKDFTGLLGIDDPQTMTRMVASHETQVCAAMDLQTLSSFAATEMYLQFAEDQWVEALSTSDEAGDALILLGRIEQSLAPQDHLYRGSVTLSMHRAAARICPDKPFVRRELGITMADQGLDQDAAMVLRQSVSMGASRRGFRHLETVSHRIGDQQTVALCRQALESSALPADSTVTQLQPDAFAKTGPAPTPLEVTAAAVAPVEEPKTASKWSRFFKR